MGSSARSNVGSKLVDGARARRRRSTLGEAPPGPEQAYDHTRCRAIWIEKRASCPVLAIAPRGIVSWVRIIEVCFAAAEILLPGLAPQESSVLLLCQCRGGEGTRDERWPVPRLGEMCRY